MSARPMPLSAPFTPLQTTLMTALGTAVLSVIAVAVTTAAVVLWVVATACWSLTLVRRGSTSRQAASRRGPLRTLAWIPLAGPFVIGLVLYSLFELLSTFAP